MSQTDLTRCEEESKHFVNISFTDIVPNRFDPPHPAHSNQNDGISVQRKISVWTCPERSDTLQGPKYIFPLYHEQRFKKQFE